MDTKLLNGIMEAAGKAGEIILSAGQEKGIMTKEGRANFVTIYDDKVQEYLFDAMKKLIPDAYFVGEEEDKEAFLPEYAKGYSFVIDPIDGTNNFMRNYGLSVTSIGLMRDGEPYIGVVYNPYTGQMFTAQKGMGAYENGEQLHTGEEPLARSLVSMGTAPYYADELSKEAFELGHWYLKQCLDIRRSGSAAYDFCMVASGRIGLFYEPMMQLWDYCAGALIVQEAGGTVTDMAGKPLSFRGKGSICAATAGVAREAYLPVVN